VAKVLIVDDSGYARRVHRGVIESGGHSVIEASTGMGAIESYSLERPDLVLLDLSMEDLGGVEVLRTLREMDPEAQVVVLSADVQSSTEHAVLTGGARRFLPKPVNRQALLSAVEEVPTRSSHES
jgi:two-component system chemotaxis response regulator CheY